jgi:hypothetical protein
MALDKKILSIDSDDDNKDYQAFDEFLQEDTNRKKNHTASEIEQIGDTLLEEIEIKKTRQEIKRGKHILYILKHDDRIYSEKLLKSYSYEDIYNIYLEVKQTKRSAIAKFFHFLFNFD